MELVTWLVLALIAAFLGVLGWWIRQRRERHAKVRLSQRKGSLTSPDAVRDRPPSAAPQEESAPPSMEEILSSIRRIIADEEAEEKHPETMSWWGPRKPMPRL